MDEWLIDPVSDAGANSLVLCLDVEASVADMMFKVLNGSVL